MAPAKSFRSPSNERRVAAAAIEPSQRNTDVAAGAVERGVPAKQWPFETWFYSMLPSQSIAWLLKWLVSSRRWSVVVDKDGQ